LASGAPPSPFETASGFFSTDRTRRTKVPRDPLLEFGSSTELACFAFRPPCPFSDPARLREPCRSRALRDRLSWGSFSFEHNYVGCPFAPGPALRPFLRTRIASPSSVPSSGFLPLSTVPATHAALHEPLRSPPFCRGAPTLRSLVSCCSRPFGVALQSFPFPGSRTHSRGPSFFLAGSRSTAAGATRPGVSRSLSPSRQLFAWRPTRR